MFGSGYNDDIDFFRYKRREKTDHWTDAEEAINRLRQLYSISISQVQDENNMTFGRHSRLTGVLRTQLALLFEF